MVHATQVPGANVQAGTRDMPRAVSCSAVILAAGLYSTHKSCIVKPRLRSKPTSSKPHYRGVSPQPPRLPAAQSSFPAMPRHGRSHFSRSHKELPLAKLALASAHPPACATVATAAHGCAGSELATNLDQPERPHSQTATQSSPWARFRSFGQHPPRVRPPSNPGLSVWESLHMPLRPAAQPE